MRVHRSRWFEEPDDRFSFDKSSRMQEMMETCMTITRRRLFTAASMTAGAIGCGALAGHALADASKAPKSAVGYQGGPKGDQSCGVCGNFMPPDGCRIVASPVTPNAWCRLFQPKSSAG
jgi:hypothetical protein